ncbi:hypothetical protein [Verminephrobacter eiseniae]|nr:hypothetical protein [Verminephrobacter eiseniae]
MNIEIGSYEAKRNYSASHRHKAIIRSVLQQLPDLSTLNHPSGMN